MHTQAHEYRHKQPGHPRYSHGKSWAPFVPRFGLGYVLTVDAPSRVPTHTPQWPPRGAG